MHPDRRREGRRIRKLRRANRKLEQEVAFLCNAFEQLGRAAMQAVDNFEYVLVEWQKKLIVTPYYLAYEKRRKDDV